MVINSTPKLLCGLSIVIVLVAGFIRTGAEEYLSNLGTWWDDPNSIGDIHVLNSDYGPYVVQFFTGSGTNEGRYAKMYGSGTGAAATNAAGEHFLLDSVTFEFIGGPASPWTNISMTIQVFQQAGSQSNLLGELGNDTENPTPTQWPKSTTFIDFHPLTNIVLEPASEYFVLLSEPVNFPNVFGLLFAISPEYETSTNWRMGKTGTRNPWAAGEYLKFAVNATAIRGSNSASGAGTNSTRVSVSSVVLSANRVADNIVLSWPISTAPSQLYSSPSFASGVWSPVAAQPLTIKSNFVVTIPLSGSASYFRLQEP